MVYFVLTFKVPLLLWTLLIASTYSDKVKGRLPVVGVISSFLEQFIRPYIESIQVNSGKPRATEESKVEKAIRLKVSDLKPMLQDSEVNDKPKAETENNLTLEGNDETTIIEFVTKTKKKSKEKPAFRENKQETDSFQKNINKYKQLRQDIKKMLEKEKTSSSTITMITRTLDEMIAQLIERQCTWKTVDATELKNRLFKGPKNTRRTMKQLQKLSNQEWISLRKQYLNFLQFNHGQEDKFMKQFHDLFSNVMNDTWNLSNRYKVRCQLLKLELLEVKPLLREDEMVEKNKCDSFKVCTDELKDFLTNFYTYLNDTAVSTFRNYAAMYLRDVKADGNDKDNVVSVLETISNIAERKISKIFRKEVDNFTLDENKKKGANIQHINDFITATTDKVKTVLTKNLDYELRAMKTKLFSTVKEDLTVNLKVDMDNLGKVFMDRVCALFAMCNGKYAARRLNKPWIFRPKKSENVYVKVQLTLDDKLRDSLARFGKQKAWQGKYMSHRFAKSFGGMDELKYSNITVTRTTIIGTNTTVSN